MSWRSSYEDQINSAEDLTTLDVILHNLGNEYRELKQIGAAPSDLDLSSMVQAAQDRQDEILGTPKSNEIRSGSVILETIRNTTSDITLGLFPATSYHEQAQGEMGRLANVMTGTYLGGREAGQPYRYWDEIPQPIKNTLYIVAAILAVYFVFLIIRKNQ